RDWSSDVCSSDLVEGAALERGNALGGQLAPAVDQPREFGAVEQGLARNLLVVGLVGLAEVRGVGKGNGALVAHPAERGTRIEPSREGDSDFLSDRQTLKDIGQGDSPKQQMITERQPATGL